MSSAAPVHGPGKRDVDPVLGDRAVELGALERGLPLADRLLHRLADGVERHPGLAVAHVAERELQLALPAEVLHARVVELRDRRRRGDRTEGLLLQGLRVHGGDCIYTP